jgi:hypothetical protein
MLFGAIIAQAHLRDFDIDDDAATFFATQALDRIEKRNQTEEARYSAVMGAIVVLPSFFAKLERAKPDKHLTKSAATDVLKTLTVDCVYPWCTDLP